MVQDPNNYWEQLERLEKLIRASELKAGVIFSFHSLILGLFADRLERFSEIFKGSTLLIILSILWLSSVLISIYYCFRVFKPQIEMKYDRNVFFFKNAAEGFSDVKEFNKKLIEIIGNGDMLSEQLSEQIHVESKIINQKFISVQKSIRFFGISFAFIIIILVLATISL